MFPVTLVLHLLRALELLFANWTEKLPVACSHARHEHEKHSLPLMLLHGTHSAFS